MGGGVTPWRSLPLFWRTEESVPLLERPSGQGQRMGVRNWMVGLSLRFGLIAWFLPWRTDSIELGLKCVEIVN
jgi:hypothetical protein